MGHTKKMLPVCCLVAGLAAGAAALASEVSPVSIAASGCANCHGPDGRSPGSIPSIAGASLDVLKAKLLAFRADQAPGTTVMTRLAKGFSEAELMALAEHFAAQTP